MLVALANLTTSPRRTSVFKILAGATCMDMTVHGINSALTCAESMEAMSMTIVDVLANKQSLVATALRTGFS